MKSLRAQVKRFCFHCARSMRYIRTTTAASHIKYKDLIVQMCMRKKACPDALLDGVSDLEKIWQPNLLVVSDSERAQRDLSESMFILYQSQLGHSGLGCKVEKK